MAKILGQDWARMTFGPRVRELAQVTFDFAKLLVPKRTYRLHDSLRLKTINALVYHVTEGAKHGGILRKGSPSHDIFPRVKQALYWPSAEHPVACVLDHPGYKPNTYNEGAAKYGKARVEKVGQQMSNDVVRMVG